MGVVFYAISILLSVFDFLLLVRALCSWVPSFRNSIVYRLSFTVTEPILSPIRDMLFRFEWARRCPIDISFLVVIILVNILSSTTSYLSVVLR